MVEVPEHLLKRSREARQALSGEAQNAVPPSGESKPSDVVANEPAPSTPTKAVAPVEPALPTPSAPYVTAALTRRKIPWWAAGTLLLLPIWAITYVGTLERPTVEATGILAHGEEVYEGRCSSCHGASGGGGAGRQLSDGEVLRTFPDIEEQVDWVVRGSDGYGVGNRYGDPSMGHIVEGGMPAFGDVLTAEELIGAVLYERIRFGGSEGDLLLAEAIDHAIQLGELDLSVYLDTEATTPETIAELLAGVGEHDDGEMAAG